jgi:hypothetical protein
MELFVISTNMDGCLFGNYFTETLQREEAEEKLKQVQKADPNAKLLKVVIEKGGNEFNADKENS